MKISKGNVQNINRKILAGTVAFVFLTTKLFGYKIIKHIKYSNAKSEYEQIETINLITSKESVIIPEKSKLSFFEEVNVFKDNGEKNRGNQLNEKMKKRALRRYYK